MRFHWLLAGLVIAAGCSTSAAAQQMAYDSTTPSWTMMSGPVSYRLLRDGERVAFDYFGPTSRMRSRPDTTQPSPSDLTGIAADQPLDSASLRLVSDSIVQVSSGVLELRLHLRHASLPLELDVRY